MLQIEPCCTQKHLLALRSKLGENGTAFWHGYGDLSLAELLPHILTRYSETEMLLAVPALPDAAAETVKNIMQKQWMRMDGKGKLNVRSATCSRVIRPSCCRTLLSSAISTFLTAITSRR